MSKEKNWKAICEELVPIFPSDIDGTNRCGR